MFIWTNSLKNLREMATLLPVWLWMLIGTGFFAGGFSSRANVIRLFLLATLAPLAVLIVFYYVSPGYIEVYLPVFFLWGAGGLGLLEKFLVDRLETVCGTRWRVLYGRVPLAVTVTAVCSLLVFAPQIRADVPDSAYRWEMDEGRRAEKHIGLLLKENLPPGKIMTRWARIAFYAERAWVNIPAGVELDSVIRTARDNGVRFLVADGVLYSNQPELGIEIFEPLMDEDQPYGKFFMTDQTRRIRGLRRRSWQPHRNMAWQWWKTAPRRPAPVAAERQRQGRGLRILDAGCGTGRLCQLLVPFGSVSGCDFSEEALACCRERGVDVFPADLNDLDLSAGHYDVITSIDTLYHQWVADDAAVVSAFHRALRPGGILVLNLVAHEFLRSSHDVAVHTRKRYTHPKWSPCSIPPASTWNWPPTASASSFSP